VHDPEYRRSLKDWESFVETLTEKVIEVDDTIPELPLKDIIFRIYRDIRFSKDPTPYKVSKILIIHTSSYDIFSNENLMLIFEWLASLFRGVVSPLLTLP
jgi:uncharacterized protein (DUF2461 family)